MRGSAGNWKSEIGKWRFASETGNRKLETGDAKKRKLEIGNWKSKM
jgi:hypothetical protein